MRWKLFIYRENNINTWVTEKAFNKPKEILDMLEKYKGFWCRIVDLSTLGILQYITPTIAFLLGVFVYHEYFSANMLITFILIWTGLIIYSTDGILQLKKMRKGRIDN